MQHGYTSFWSLTIKKALRRIEAHERAGWEFILMQPLAAFVLGAGGYFGQTVVMRRRLE